MVFFISRSMSAFSVVSFPHANPDGTAAKFGDEAQAKLVRAVTIAYVLLAYALAICLSPAAGIGLAAVSLLTFLFYYRFCMKYFGGMTGDLAGFFTCICELACLLEIVIVLKVLG